MKAIVIGATGTIGNAVVKKLKKSGYEVIGASPSSENYVDFEKDSSIEQLLTDSGKVDVIVSAAGVAAFGAVEKLTDQEFDLSIRNKLMGQVKLLQKGLRYLNSGGTILLTGGIFAYKPMPGSAAIAMVNAGLEGFVRAASQEIDQNRKAIVIHPPLVAETAQKMGIDPSPFLSAEEVADAYLDAINSGESGSPFFVRDNTP